MFRTPAKNKTKGDDKVNNTKEIIQNQVEFWKELKLFK